MSHKRQDVKTNQQDCVRLAQRAARLLTDLGRRMEGKWEDAPQSLLENIRELEAWVSRTRALSSLAFLPSHVLPFFLRLSQDSALDTWLYAQGRANEMDQPISGKDERTGRVDGVWPAAEGCGHVFPGAPTALLILGAMKLNVGEIRSPHW
jgi:hypothetical protein